MWVLCFDSLGGGDDPLTVYIQTADTACFYLADAMQFFTKEDAERFLKTNNLEHFEARQIGEDKEA